FVIKRDSKRTSFDRDKLTRSVKIALRKRPVDQDKIDQLVSGIARELESIGESEVSSKDIGQMVMERLREVDPVGYVRYASVYKDFGDPKDFAAFIEDSALDE
ncbi:MAG: ATP cone domain-containing protein, partial [Pseudomonadota bacterium]